MTNNVAKRKVRKEAWALKKGVFASLSCLVLWAVIFCMSLNSYAAPRVISSKQPWCVKCKLFIVHPKGKCAGGGVPGMDPVHYDLFRRGENVYAKGTGFNPPNDLVDIYVVADKDWTIGDRFGPLNLGDPQDITPDGVEQATVGRNGVLRCTKVWGKPLVAGDYDIIVDANQDGTLNSGDAADGAKIGGVNTIGFRVK